VFAHETDAAGPVRTHHPGTLVRDEGNERLDTDGAEGGEPADAALDARDDDASQAKDLRMARGVFIGEPLDGDDGIEGGDDLLDGSALVGGRLHPREDLTPQDDPARGPGVSHGAARGRGKVDHAR